MLSAPNQWSLPGPWRATPRNVSLGSLSGRRSASTAPNSSSVNQTIDAQNQKPSLRLRYVPAGSEESADAGIPASVWTSTTSSADMANPWIEDGVQEVDEEVHQDEAQRDDDDDTLHDEEVLLEDRRADDPAETGQREDLLDHERPTDQRGDAQAEDGQERERRRPQRMAPQDAPVGHALGLGGRDEVLLQRRDHVAAEHPHVRGRLRERQCEGRQRHVLEVLDRIVAEVH